MLETPLWTGEAVIDAVSGKADRTDWSASGVSIDSRSIEPGDLFIAIVGPVHDGHDFAAVAAERGAAALVLSRRPEGLPKDAIVILVEDTQTALENLGRAGRARSKAQIAAVTGSVGKTGSKEALRHILSKQGKTHASVGSFNNHWGVPLSLARMPEDCRYAIFEIGMNHPGELGPLARMVRPHVALITTIEAVHLAHFTDVTEIARAKAEIFEGLGPNGSAVLNADNDYAGLLRSLAVNAGVSRIVMFGEARDAAIRLTDYTLYPEYSDVAVRYNGGEIFFRLGAPGRHWISNILGVLGVVNEFGIDPGKATATLADLRPPKGRGERHRVACAGGNYTVIDESYNASPASIRAALELLRNLQPEGKGRRIAVLGDMLELGPRAAEIHRSLAADVDAAGVDLLFTCGPNMEHLSKSVPVTIRTYHEASSDLLIQPLLETVGAGDVILIKGSFGSRMSVPLEALLDAQPPVSAAGQGGF